jgi:hypothetical protein
MKHLKEFILEAKVKSFSKDEMIKLFGKASPQIAQFIDAFTNNFLSSLSKKYSLGNKTDRDNLYTKFMKICGNKFDKKFLQSILLSSVNGLSALILDNIDLFNSKLEEPKFVKKESKVERALKQWKTTDEYTPLEEYDEDNEYPDDDENGRAFVIYYAYDPADKESLRVYYINGKTTDPNVKHIQNMHRADWNYETKLGYYHANTCTVEYYRKSGKEQLIQDYISNDDIYEEE